MGDSKTDPSDGTSPPPELTSPRAPDPPGAREPSLTPAQRRLVERYLPLVKEIAKREAWRLFRLDRDDLLGAGHLGLIQAAQRYQPDAGVPFRGFAYYRIRGAMLDLARKSDRPGRRHAVALRSLEATQDLLSHAHARHQRAEVTSMEARVAKANELVGRAAAALAMAHYATDEVHLAAGRDDEIPENALIHNDLGDKLKHALNTMDMPDRALIQAVYFDNVSMTQYAARLGVNASTVSRRHAKIMRDLAASIDPHRH
ncbi:MAG: sigma-70 family RNA polymerase sigma factor [Nannocystaceae bacterium]